MFHEWHGRQTLPFTITNGHFNPLFFASQIDTPVNAIYFKVVNAGNTSQSLNLSFHIPYSAVNGTILEAPTPGDLNAFNYFNNKTATIPKPVEGLQGSGLQEVANCSAGGFNWTVAPYSVSVLQFDLGTQAENSTYRSWRREMPPATKAEQRSKLAYDLEQALHA